MCIAADPIIHSKLFFLRRFFLFTEKKKRQNKKIKKGIDLTLHSNG